jgi:cytochrome c
MDEVALIIILTAATFLLGACEQREQDVVPTDRSTLVIVTAATLGKQELLTSKDYLEQHIYASADTNRGEILSMQCRTCHTLEKDGVAIVGPNLFGIFGKIAASAPDFSYSEVLATSDFIWTPRTLDAWLAKPFVFLPGNRMSFSGLPDRKDRNSLIAYLLQQTDSGTKKDVVDSTTDIQH